MRPLSSAEIRQMFFDFFQEKKHQIEPSASLIPQDDPSLLWINSGVATLKKYFDGSVIPDNPRLTNCQKSIRTNDIENVGKTARHHTFFEMLGNFSIGDYFKKEAIHWAWEFLTEKQWIGFDPERLSVTIHLEDDEAFRIWNEDIGIPKERIVRLEGNFWDIGEGPCGPQTEIFYDRGPEFGNDENDPELYPGGENERYLEIWNLVFSQYNHNPDDTYTPLPKKNIDTGMGLERMVSVIQDVPTNFDTDLFQPIIQHTAEISKRQYGQALEDDVAFKVIADHARTVVFAIGDGALPSNEGRGYVIRRLLRRAVRYGKVLDIHEPFLYRLTETVANVMGAFYPEIVERADFISNVIESEEERFHETLNDGLRILTDMIDQLREKNKSELSGEQAFLLYDTYGFPLDLTEDFAAEQDVTIDRDGFEAEMNKQRQRARAARQDADSMNVQGGVRGDVGVTSTFVGYEQLQTQTTVQAIVRDGQLVDVAGTAGEYELVLEETPFYAESGGQVADHGTIYADGVQFKVTDVQKGPNGQHFHIGTLQSGTLSQGQNVQADVSKQTRHPITKNHTATHLLHQALKDVLGDHVNQAGSLVEADRLRFDFSHFHAISKEELDHIESIVNEHVWRNVPVQTMYRSLDEAKAMGATALFGEKYGHEVRVVQIGEYSLELCGGCHVGNTAEIGLFTIVSESGIGAGTRRIEALTGKAAYEHVMQRVHQMQTCADILRTTVDQLPQRVDALQQQVKDLQRENESLKAKSANEATTNLLQHAQQVHGVSVIYEQVDGVSMDHLRNMVDELKQKLDEAVIVLATAGEGKVNIVAGVTQDVVKKGVHSGKLVKEIASRCGGGGGGRPDMAQAGGKDAAKLPDALAIVPEFVQNILHS